MGTGRKRRRRRAKGVGWGVSGFRSSAMRSPPCFSWASCCYYGARSSHTPLPTSSPNPGTCAALLPHTLALTPPLAEGISHVHSPAPCARHCTSSSLTCLQAHTCTLHAALTRSPCLSPPICIILCPSPAASNASLWRSSLGPCDRLFISLPLRAMSRAPFPLSIIFSPPEPTRASQGDGF